jgi:nucleotide-binding universal stress UspA family protein
MMPPPFEKILVPTDFSPTSHHAFQYAVALARQTGAALHLLHVIAYPVEIEARPEARWAEVAGRRQRLRDDAEREIAGLTPFADGVKVTTKVVGGSPSRAIVLAAKHRKFQLIVMGAHDRNGVGDLVLGSVAERVGRTAPCPVLTVSAATEAAEAMASARIA